MALMQFRYLVLLVLGAAFLWPFEKNSATATSEPGHILLDLVVRDKHGRLVNDLTAGELRITDEGAPVKPTSLRLVTPGDGQTQGPRLITLVFEKFGPEGRTLAREGALAFVKDAAGSNVYFSVISIGGEVQLAQNFTSDPKLARAAIESVTSPATRKPLPQNNIAATGAEGVDSVLTSMMLRAVDPALNSSRRGTHGDSIQALLALAREERAVAGRKTLVYFCEGLEVSESQRQQFQEVIEAANRANLSIYPIDVSGLAPEGATSATAPSTGLNLNQSVGGGVAMANVGLGAGQDVHRINTPRLKTDAGGPALGALAQLAASTGGYLVSNTNDVRKQAHRIAEESATYYEVTYAPPPAPLDGHFRPVEVAVERPKMNVQSRNGYLAVPSVAGHPMQAFEVPLLKELDTPSPRHDFYHSARAVPLGPKAQGVEYAILVETTLGDLQIQEDMKGAVCRIHGAALAVVRDANGRIVERFGLDGPFQGPLDRKETYRRSPWLMEERVVLAPGSYTLETMVADLLADRASVQRRNFQVENWDSSSPHVSAFTYVRSVVSTRAGVRRAFETSDRAIEPQLEQRLPGGKGSAVTLYFLARGGHGSSAPVNAEVKLFSGDREVSSGVVYQGEASGEKKVLSTLDVSSIPGGEYQVHVILTQGDKTSRSTLPLTIDRWQNAGIAIPTKLNVTAKKAGDWDSSPASDEQKQLLEAARGRALGYTQKLPNFLCLQTTRRLEDPTGNQDWRQKDEYSEVITWYNGVETYSHAGGRNRTKNTKTDPVRVTSAGEFGSLLKTIFVPESKADFRWIRSESLGGRSAEVFAYRIAAENSQYNVNYLGKHPYHAKPGYHGIVTIDSNTAETLHLEAEIQELPDEILVDQLQISVDYETASVAGTDFLLPSVASLVTHLPRLVVRNEMRFSGYRRFDSDTNIQYLPSK